MAPLLDDGPIWYFEEKKLVWSFLPRKCRVSGETLWFKKAYRVRFYDPAGHEDRWYCQREYLWKLLKET
jgi:hypothetical protein